MDVQTHTRETQLPVVLLKEKLGNISWKTATTTTLIHCKVFLGQTHSLKKQNKTKAQTNELSSQFMSLLQYPCIIDGTRLHNSFLLYFTFSDITQRRMCSAQPVTASEA